jgi:hypothetical protein
MEIVTVPAKELTRCDTYAATRRRHRAEFPSLRSIVYEDLRVRIVPVEQNDECQQVVKPKLAVENSATQNMTDQLIL